MARTHSAAPARWYPAPPPALPGENDERYTNRLLGDDNPYDHRRNRQCSIGWHRECSRWRTGDETCRCPCHSDTDVPAAVLPTVNSDAVTRMRGLYSLPHSTARRVLHLGRQAIKDGARTLDAFREHIGATYQSEISEGFGIDLAWALDCADYLEGCPPAPLAT